MCGNWISWTRLGRLDSCYLECLIECDFIESRHISRAQYTAIITEVECLEIAEFKNYIFYKPFKSLCVLNHEIVNKAPSLIFQSQQKIWLLVYSYIFLHTKNSGNHFKIDTGSCYWSPCSRIDRRAFKIWIPFKEFSGLCCGSESGTPVCVHVY